ncbi:hypothetical protein BDZ45DRAFT_677423 [Acephala macrosclerotiorum]|nr:hypothetical protein BDZ45DRAFT_677423 [Acephala macrosclerotiorum]
MATNIEQEGTTGVIELPNDDPKIIKRVIDYLYKGDYVDLGLSQVPPATTATDSTAAPAKKHLIPSLITSTGVCISADKWDIPALKTLAAQKYKEALPIQGLSDKFVTTLETMYTSLPESDTELKKVALGHIGAQYRLLVKRPDFLKLGRKHSEIAVAALEAVAAVPEKSATVSCSEPCCKSPSSSNNGGGGGYMSAFGFGSR